VPTTLYITRITIAFSFLIYASWSDYKTREVSNAVWAVFAPIGLTLTMIDLYLSDSSSLIAYGICFALTAAVSLALFYSGGFGGADSKALMCLALALPFYPTDMHLPLLGEASPISRDFFPLTIFTNGVVLSAASAIFILLYNLISHARNRTVLFEGDHKKEPFWKRTLVLLTGYKMPLAKLREKWHIYPLEDAHLDPYEHVTRKLVLLPKDEGRNEVIERLDKAASNGKIQQYVWATPGLPMLIFITIGFAFTFILGDIVWTCIRLVLG
jgi:preflagellin peptidase FlaK